MFDVAPTELLLVGLVALLVIGPKDLPRVMRTVGRWVGQMRGVARHFRAGLDEMIRQSEIEEMERKWAEENARIMREHPSPPMLESPDPDPEPPVEPAAAEPATSPAASPEPVARDGELPFPERPA